MTLIQSLGATQGFGIRLPVMRGVTFAARMNNPLYAAPTNIIVSAIVLVSILRMARFVKGFIANNTVLLGIVIGAAWFGLITPFHFGAPTLDLWMILTMTLVMIVVMIGSTGMFLALGDMTGKKGPINPPSPQVCTQMIWARWWTRCRPWF